MTKKVILSAVASIALSMVASSAFAQDLGGFTPTSGQTAGGSVTYDNAVARDACAPRFQVVTNGTYVGCTQQQPAASQRVDIGNRPPVLAVATGGGPAQGGGLQFVTTESAMAMYGAEGVDMLIQQNYEACRSIERRQGWSRAWGFIRPVLTVAGIVYGAGEFGNAYGVLLGLNGVREEVGARIHDGDTRDWRNLMIHHCTLSRNWERRYGASLAGTDSGF